MIAIKVENVTKIFKKNVRGNLIQKLLFPKYKDFKAVDSVSFEVEKGEIFGLLGPNGAGKTTTILMLCGLEYPTGGKIYINSLDITHHFNQINSKFNVLFSDKLLYNRLTAFDNLVFYANLYASDDPEGKAKELLNLVELGPWKDQFVENFSLGMRMKLALARCLINNPQILYLDEPTLGLDVKNAEFVRKILSTLDCTIILTTHYLNEAILLCDRIGILQKGKLVHIGTPSELKIKSLSSRSFLMHTNDNQAVKEILEANPLVSSVVEKNMKLEIAMRKCDNFFDILTDEIKKYQLYDFHELKTGLEGLFDDVEFEIEDSS